MNEMSHYPNWILKAVQEWKGEGAGNVCKKRHISKGDGHDMWTNKSKVHESE